MSRGQLDALVYIATPKRTEPCSEKIGPSGIASSEFRSASQRVTPPPKASSMLPDWSITKITFGVTRVAPTVTDAQVLSRPGPSTGCASRVPKSLPATQRPSLLQVPPVHAIPATQSAVQRPSAAQYSPVRHGSVALHVLPQPATGASPLQGAPLGPMGAEQSQPASTSRERKTKAQAA